jgi:hypothetical protein
MDEVQTIHYRGRHLRILYDGGFRVVVFHEERELYSTSARFEEREEALRSAKALVDVELTGGTVTPANNDRIA